MAIGVAIGIPFQRISGGAASLWTIVSSGLCYFRKGERSGRYVIDKSTDGGTTWELNIVVLELDEDSIIMSIDDGVAGYRQQVRSCVLYIDNALTPLGFAGVEDTDWEWIWSTATI
jgi:hypothetical protein